MVGLNWPLVFFVCFAPSEEWNNYQKKRKNQRIPVLMDIKTQQFIHKNISNFWSPFILRHKRHFFCCFKMLYYLVLAGVIQW